MKAALFWLCLFIAGLASYEGHPLKKTKPVKFNFKLANRIETRQRSEKLKKETSKEKHIRCSVINSSRTIRCSLVKKCPNQDPTCSTFRQVRQTMENVQESRMQKASIKQKALRSKCSNTKNPLCIHDIWVGKRSNLNQVPKNEENILSTLCDPEDEICLLTIKRAKEGLKMSLEKDTNEVNTEPEVKMTMSGRNSSPTRCDFIRDPNCKLEGSPETPSVIEDVLKRLQKGLPTIKRQKSCKGKKPGKICRWRPQPNDTHEDQKPSGSSSSSTKDDITTARRRSVDHESN